VDLDPWTARLVHEPFPRRRAASRRTVEA
jgi:hypothetical protein